MTDNVHGDLCGKFRRITVNSCGNTGKRNGTALFFSGAHQGIPVTCGKKLRLMVRSAAPDGTRSVDHITAGQAIGGSDHGFPGAAPPELAALLKKPGTGGTVNRAVHTSAAEKRAIRRIDDGVDRKFCDVSGNDTDFHRITSCFKKRRNISSACSSCSRSVSKFFTIALPADSMSG